MFDCPFVNVKIANFTVVNSRTFICNLSPFSDHFPSADTPLQKVSQPDFYASVCITKFGSFCLSYFPCLTLNFPPTKEVPVLTDCLILSLVVMKKPGLVIVSVVVVNTL